MPASTSCFGLTGMIGPANPPSSRLRSTVAPTLRGFSDAPMTATDWGRKKCSRFLMLIVDSLYDQSFLESLRLNFDIVIECMPNAPGRTRRARGIAGGFANGGDRTGSERQRRP